MTARGRLLCISALLLAAITPALAAGYSTVAGRVQALEGSRFAHVAQIGKSVEGRPIYAIAVAASLSPDKPRVLIMCGQHGSERSACYSMLRLAKDISNTDNPRLRALLEKLVIVIVPVVNPDGFTSLRRFNSAGADLNRDWISASQPETRAVLRLVKRIRPQVVLDLHEWTDADPNKRDCMEVPGFGDQAGNKMARLLSLDTSMPKVYYRPQTDPRLAHRYFTEHGICAMLVETSPKRGTEARQLAYRKLVLQIMAAVASPEPAVGAQLASLQTHAHPQFGAFASSPKLRRSTDPRQVACSLILLASAGLLIVRSICRRPQSDNGDCGSYRVALTDLVRSNIPVHARVALLQQYRLRPTDRAKQSEGVVLKLRPVRPPV